MYTCAKYLHYKLYCIMQIISVENFCSEKTFVEKSLVICRKKLLQLCGKKLLQLCHSCNTLLTNSLENFHSIYSTVQLQLHIITRYHACQCVQHAKSSRVPQRDSAWYTSTAMSNIVMHGHARQLINSTRL